MACKMACLAILFSLSLIIPSTLGTKVICEDLPAELCSFAISSSSKRCVLENMQVSGHAEYQCRTSEVVVERMSDVIESDECVKTCGVDRSSVGISSDSLLEAKFTEKLCSPECSHNCPNIVDLYFNLAAGEGVFLPDLCDAQRYNPHRAMLELLSSGAAVADFDAAAPTSAPSLAVDAPASAPAFAPASSPSFADSPAFAPSLF